MWNALRGTRFVLSCGVSHWYLSVSKFTKVATVLNVVATIVKGIFRSYVVSLVRRTPSFRISSYFRWKVYIIWKSASRSSILDSSVRCHFRIRWVASLKYWSWRFRWVIQVRSRRIVLSHKYCANDSGMTCPSVICRLQWPSDWTASCSFVVSHRDLCVHLCSSVNPSSCEWTSCPNRDVIHSDTMRKRKISSLIESWMSSSVVTSTKLLRTQTQGRAAQLDPT